MSVYVDGEENSFGRMVMCHMLADTLPELHAMATKLGLRKWFQDSPPASHPHYDVCKSKRAQAIRLGVISIDRYKTVALMREWRGDFRHLLD